MKKYLARTQGFDFEKNELFIVSGGQQCADLTTKVLVNEGDVILTEDPAFVGCLNTFRSYGAKLVGVPMQQDGMDIDALEAALKGESERKAALYHSVLPEPLRHHDHARKAQKDL